MDGARILVLQHCDEDGPGTLAEALAADGAFVEVRRPDLGDRLRDALAACDGLLLMGGPMSVNDPLSWIDDECALIREAVSVGMPVLGVCLGGQLVAKALGGAVTRHAVGEIGWFEAERCGAEDERCNAEDERRDAEDGRRDAEDGRGEKSGGRDGVEDEPWLAGLPARIPVFHWHGETFSTLPPGARQVLRGEVCGPQGFVAGSALGLQFHPEMTAAMVRAWCRDWHEAVEEARPTVQSAPQILANLEPRIAGLRAVATTLARTLHARARAHAEARGG